MVAKTRVTQPSLTEVIALIKSNPQMIEEGLTPIDTDLFIPNVGEIDIVAVSDNHLVLVTTFVEINEAQLRKTASINQWVFENLTVLKHVYSGKGLAPNFLPRILILCSRINPQANPLIPFLTDLPLEVHRYKYLSGGGKSWLETEKIDPQKIASTDQKKYSLANSNFFTNLPSKAELELTQEEIGAFFSEELTGEGEPEVENRPALEDLDFTGPYFN